MVRNMLIAFLRKMGLEQPKLAQSSSSFAHSKEGVVEFGSNLAYLAMKTEEIGDKLLVSLLQVTSS